MQLLHDTFYFSAIWRLQVPGWNDRKHRRKHLPNSVPRKFDTREQFDHNIASFTSIVINHSVSSSCNDRSLLTYVEKTLFKNLQGVSIKCTRPIWMLFEESRTLMSLCVILYKSQSLYVLFGTLQQVFWATWFLGSEIECIFRPLKFLCVEQVNFWHRSLNDKVLRSNHPVLSVKISS